jgi:beta-galactosidase GanA
VRVTGRDAKILVAGYDLGGQRLVWSSSELMTHATIQDRDVAVFYGTEGSSGMAELRYSSAPMVTVLEGAVAAAFDATTGNLQLQYTHAGLARVRITGGGRRDLLLLLTTDAGAAAFWRIETPAGVVLVRGSSLVRAATAGGRAVHLRADTAQPGEVEVFAAASRLFVNGERISVEATASGSIVGWLPGPRDVRLPELTGWRVRPEAPEAAPAFDDSAWITATKITSLSPIPPQTLPILFADEYGFHQGHVWYRGRFTATGTERTVSLNAVTGRNGTYLVWLNGRYLGAASGGVEADAGPPANPDAGRGDFAIPAGVLRPGEPATLAVLVENMGHNDDWTAEEIRQRQPRGLTGASIAGSSAPIRWRIQGVQGGENLLDRVRGPLNNGGLFGERAGWHLPGLPERGWSRIGSLAHARLSPGVTWVRTRFELSLPHDQDVSVALRFTGAGETGYRALVFLNGWQVGHYIDASALQHEFVLPAGILHRHGDNSLAIAIVAPGDVAGGPGPVSLVVLGNHRGGVSVTDIDAPGFDDRKRSSP